MNNQNGDVVNSVYTDSNGNFSVDGLMAGNYTAEVTAGGRVAMYFNFVSIGGRTTYVGERAMTSELGAEELRIVLSWGANPRDLDSHLTGEGVHVYYARRTATGIALDLDDVSGYGRETITVDMTEVRDGSYQYYVYLYSGSGTLGTSDANVKVYSGNELIKSYNVPSDLTDRYWYVFTIDTVTGKITNN